MFIRITSFLALGFSLAYLFALTFSSLDDLEYLSYCIAALTILSFLNNHAVNALTGVILICAVYLFIIPIMGLLFFEGINLTVALPVVTIFALTAFQLNKLKTAKRKKNRNKARSAFTVFSRSQYTVLFSLGILGSLTAVLFASGGHALGSLLFLFLYSASIVAYERLLHYQLNQRTVFVCLMVFMLVLGFYIKFVWSGYGRIAIASIAMIPFFITSRHDYFVIRSWHIVLASPILLLIAQVSRYGSSSNIKNMYSGSASHHLEITSDLMSSHDVLTDVGINSFIEQYLLLFLNWFPRSVWELKPTGLGYSIVDDWYSRSGYGNDYSVSVGFVGEQLYLLGPLFLVGLLITVSTLMYIRTVLLRLSAISIAVAFDVSLISYVWGGSASFGSRAWAFILPMLVFVLIERIFGRYKLKQENT